MSVPGGSLLSKEEEQLLRRSSLERIDTSDRGR